MGGKVCQLLCLSFCPFVSVYNIPMTMNVLVCVLSVFVYVCKYYSFLGRNYETHFKLEKFFFDLKQLLPMNY